MSDVKSLNKSKLWVLVAKREGAVRERVLCKGPEQADAKGLVPAGSTVTACLRVVHMDGVAT